MQEDRYAYLRTLPSGAQFIYQEEDEYSSCENEDCACETVIICPHEVK